MVGAFTSGKKTEKKSKQYPWVEGALPIAAATTLHIKLVKPSGERDEKGWEMCLASSLSPVIVCDAHDGTLLAEVSEGHFRSQFNQCYLQIWISKATIKAIGAAVKSNTPFVNKKGQAESSKTFYTEEDFTRSASGLKTVSKFMEKMKSDFEKYFGTLEDAAGDIVLRKDLKVSFAELQARSGSYFKKYMKGSSHWKGLSKEYQALSSPGCLSSGMGCSSGLIDYFLIWLFCPLFS